MNILSDIRFALRLLVKNPGSSAIAVLVMAVGMCVVITMFTFVNGVLWSSPDVANGDRLVSVEWDGPEKNRNYSNAFKAADFFEFVAESKSFEALSGTGLGQETIVFNPGGDRYAMNYRYSRVTPNFLDVVGETPLLGRAFLPGDVSGSRDEWALISYKVWQEQFGGDRNAIGSTLMINGLPCTVVGVMRPGFHLPLNTQVWTASRYPEAIEAGRGFWMRVRALGILKEGVSIEQAETELNTIAARLAKEYPDTNEELLKVDVIRFTNWYAGSWLTNAGYALFCCALLVLGVACANVFNLIMSRTTTRTAELSIRNALGASRGHIVFQVLLDGFLLSALGAIGGVLIAAWSLKFIWHRFERTGEMAYWWHMNMDTNSIAFVVGVVLVSALASSLIPGLRASRSETIENLKDDSRTSSGLFIGTVSKFILGFQITAAGVLAFVSIIMMLVWVHLKNREVPYDGDRILNARTAARGLAPLEGNSVPHSAKIDFIKRLTERLRSHPGVLGAAMADNIGGLYWRPYRVALEGEFYERIEEQPLARNCVISDGFEDVFGISPLIGRGFTSLDTVDAELVCIVNKSFAERHWPNENPIGKRISFTNQGGSTNKDFRKIVGVYPDLSPKPLPGESIETSGEYLVVYLPNTQIASGRFNILLRTEGDPRLWKDTMRKDLRAIAPKLSYLGEMQTITEIQAESMVSTDIALGMFGIFGIASLVLGVVGLYAVVSFSTRQRFREFGVRMALGAGSWSIASAVIRRRTILILVGVALGVAAGHATALKIKSMLSVHELPFDIAYPIVIVTLALSLGLALGIPAWRASRISPTQALRVE